MVSGAVTDPAILAQLNGGQSGSSGPVTDPAVLSQLNGEPSPTDKGSTWANHFKNLVAGVEEIPSNILGMMNAASGNTGGNPLVLGLEKLTGQPLEEQQQKALAKTQRGINSGIGKITSLDPNKVPENGFVDTFMRNFGQSLPFLPAAIEGGIAQTAKNLVTTTGAIGGQSAVQAAGGGPVLQTVGALLGGGLAGKATTVKELLTPRSDADRGADYVSGLADTSNKTPDQIEAFGNQPGNQGKSFIGAEAIGRQGITANRALAIRPGTTGDTLGPQLEERAAGTPDRIKADVQAATGIDPDAALGNIEGVVKAGRVAAKPLYEKAFDTSGTAPFEDAFEQENNKIGRRVNDAQQAVNDASTGLTLAEAKVHNAGDNVYGANSALAERRAAQAKMDDAQSTLSDAQGEQETIDARLKQAQEDRANGVKGGVWSPRIQRLLDNPIMKKGLALGLQTQKLEADANDEPFNPKDYAVTGTDSEGSPVVGGVPNMRLLDAGKRGLDQILTERAQNNQQNPGVLPRDENTTAILNFKNAYLKELDNLNPDYKAARVASSDYLSAQDAFRRAQKMFGNPNTTNKQFQDFLGGLDSDTERTAAKGGVANYFYNLADKGQLKGAKFSQPILRKKLQGIVDDPDKAATFLMQMDAEASMAKSGQRMHPGLNSTTAESEQAGNYQDLAGAGISLGKGLYYGGKGNLVSGGANILQAWERLKSYRQTSGLNVGARNEAGSLLALPPGELASRLRAHEAQPVPGQFSKRGFLPSLPGLANSYLGGNNQ